MTETLSCDLGKPTPAVPTQETEFEKPRGVSRIEVRKGYSQVHVFHLPDPVMPARLRVLEAVKEAEVSIDFLKLTPDGLSFLVSQERTDDAERALQGGEFDIEVQKDRSIVLVHAVNIRDEEGLIAEIVNTAIGSGARVDHVGDMHDRLLMIVPSEQAATLVQRFRQRWSESVQR
jgi:aspartokinase